MESGLESRARILQAIATLRLEPWEPTPRVLGRPPDPPAAPVALVCVYRRRNAAVVGELLAHGATACALWALDEPHPDLAGSTVGTGPGSRFVLINRLLDALRPAPDTWVIVADDDARITRGSLTALVGIGEAWGLDLLQPAHDCASYISWASTMHRLGSTARLTRYVEQGPIVAFSPRARSRLLPLPEDLGMGWGIEARWAAERDLRLGVVDAVLMRHLRRVGGGEYDVAAEFAQMDRLLAEFGAKDWAELQRTDGRWPSWRTRPPRRRHYHPRAG